MTIHAIRGDHPSAAIAHAVERVDLGGQGFIVFDIDAEGTVHLSTFGPVNAGQMALAGAHLSRVALDWGEEHS